MALPQSDKLMQARCRLLTREPFYGSMALSMVWLPSDMSWLPERQRTMGVRIVNGGEVQCLYYPPFVDSMTLQECFAVIQHEIEHIVRVHCIRVGDRQPMAWNIAADFVVNGQRNKPRIGYRKSVGSEVVIPMKNDICWIPEGWPAEETTEYYYDRLLKHAKDNGCQHCDRCGRQTKGKGDKGQGSKGKDKGDKGKGGKGKGDKGEGQGDGQGEGQGQGDGGCPKCGQHGSDYEYGGIGGKALDDHSTWNQSDVSADEARQAVKDMVDQAVQKAIGNVPGHLQQAIEALGKPIVKWRELLRRYLGQHVGNRRLTHSRRNRRQDTFGLPGVSHHAAATVNVIVDTSGSIGESELRQFFAEIDTISCQAKVYVLQWDHAFQGYAKYRKGDWKKFKVAGRGGTDMVAPVTWLMDNERVADCQVMLTDGWVSGWKDQSQVSFPFITVITTSDTTPPGYGHVVRLR